MLLNRLNTLFGEPERTTKKVQAWTITRYFGFVVEVDVPQNGAFANVWLPYPQGNTSLPAVSHSVYPADKGRHSNTYQTPGLHRGEPVLKLKVSSAEDIEQLLQYLTS
ncbi:hypothetical protein JCM19237_2145 [Photobacterium aphoticum]|uniref:DUF5655 domain-containing protein n=1 Tax=Photobacterium aphoticum TaxID=754436 RepID=A0A090QQD2_9GAMM|nr:hypothetical protein JCM19237_2145 [Photobacterium aphoticum]